MSTFRSHIALVGLALSGACSTVPSVGQIQDVIVETYYVSDANDATDTIGGGLAAGSRSYRIYLDLDTGCSLRAVYGDVNHAIAISSTAVLFNHLDRGKSFGHEIGNGALDENTVALDSWLSLGAATNSKFGLLKTDDTDGSVVGGANNDGGSAGIPGGLLVNNDADAGIPLVTSDGLIPVGTGSPTPPSFNAYGLGLDSVFNDTTQASSYFSNDMRIGCSPGVNGATAENRILIAQLTTTGDLTFCLNVEIELTGGTVLKFVSSDSVLLADETLNGLLCYPPTCGCTDPNYLEYDPAAGCDDGSCATTIVFGCLDTTACNYDPTANFNVDVLCCYGVDDCNGLDAYLVCPDLGTGEAIDAPVIALYPNPAGEMVHITCANGAHAIDRIDLYDAFGRVVLSSLDGVAAGRSINIGALAAGWYAARVRTSTGSTTLPFLKH